MAKGESKAKFGLTDAAPVGGQDLPLEFLNDLILLCPDPIIGTDKAGKVIIFNRAAERLTGFCFEQVVDKKNVACFYGSVEKARFIKKQIYGDGNGGKGRLEGFECEIINHHGRKIPIRLSAALLYRDNREVGCVGFFHDITNKKRLEAELRNLSIKDNLSCLFNHRYFYLKLNEELARARRHSSALSLICIDLDGFKPFNDCLGHMEGDKIIRLVGKSLLACIREADMAFRYGGDEFMVLLPETTVDEACLCAERIRLTFDATWPLAESCLRHRLKQVTMSIGISQATPEDSPDELIRRADLAMYTAKRAGGDQILKT